MELNEFVHGCLKNKELVGMLKKKPPTEPANNKPPDVCVVLVDENLPEETVQ